MIAFQLLLRLLLDVLQPLALAVCAIILAVQEAQGRGDPLLLSLVLIGAAIEMCSALLDALLAESLDNKRLSMRLYGWVAAHLAAGAGVAVVVFIARELETSALLLLVPFVVIRFVTFVLMPPRDEVTRRRIKALARDRFDAFFLLIVILPLAVALAVILVQLMHVPSEVVLVPVACGLFAAWLLLLAAIAAVVSAPSFARRPQRLFMRPGWKRLMKRSKGREAWHMEESRWMHDVKR